MSKQLLHSYQSHVAIAALNDRAFAIIKDNDESAKSSSTTMVFELMAATNQDNEDTTKNDNDDAVGDKKEDDTTSKQTKKQKKKEQHQGNQDMPNNPHEVQSVCSTEIASCVWLAVSREDKTLSLYSVPSSSAQQQPMTTKLYPTVTYSLPKRARCLAFCSVASSDASGKLCHVIVAGDLSGDAIAFPIPDAANADKPEAVSTTTTRRLLLGHTASILTGLNVVPTTTQQQQQQLILTADRDEKIRVSHFPETHIVLGYLLGHSSFISTMDASSASSASSSRALCITGSGDGTVRLWDYQLCKEVGMVPVMIKKCEDEDEKVAADGTEEEMLEEEEDGDMDEDGEQQEGGDMDNDEEDFDDSITDDEQSFDNHTIAVPLSVALGPNAENVIVARDGINSIDVHPIPPSPTKSSSSNTSSLSSLFLSHLVSLHKKQTLECPSQPLAVRSLSDGSVLVLVREPDYLIHYQYSDGGEFENISSSSSPFSMALQGAVKDETIVMPTTTLDRDRVGEWILQKNKVNEQQPGGDANTTQDADGGDVGASSKRSGLHWNDAGRKESAKLANQRRNKRRRGNAKKEKAGDSEILLK
ncbi:hypothetical protein ACHAXR_011904 [Thalassiosira sp. AJA248-18]